MPKRFMMAAGRVLKLSAILLYFTLLNFYCKSDERQHIEGTFITRHPGVFLRLKAILPKENVS